MRTATLMDDTGSAAAAASSCGRRATQRQLQQKFRRQRCSESRRTAAAQSYTWKYSSRSSNRLGERSKGCAWRCLKSLAVVAVFALQNSQLLPGACLRLTERSTLCSSGCSSTRTAALHKTLPLQLPTSTAGPAGCPHAGTACNSSSAFPAAVAAAAEASAAPATTTWWRWRNSNSSSTPIKQSDCRSSRNSGDRSSHAEKHAQEEQPRGALLFFEEEEALVSRPAFASFSAEPEKESGAVKPQQHQTEAQQQQQHQTPPPPSSQKQQRHAQEQTRTDEEEGAAAAAGGKAEEEDFVSTRLQRLRKSLAAAESHELVKKGAALQKNVSVLLQRCGRSLAPRSPLAKRAVAAAVARAAVHTLLFPVEVVRTRIAQGTAFKDIPLGALYTGCLTAVALAEVPYALICVAVQAQAQKLLDRHAGKLPAVCSLFLSALAADGLGTLYKTPFDCAKALLQQGKASSPGQAKELLQTNEKPMLQATYKGFYAQVLRDSTYRVLNGQTTRALRAAIAARWARRRALRLLQQQQAAAAGPPLAESTAAAAAVSHEGEAATAAAPPACARSAWKGWWWVSSNSSSGGQAVQEATKRDMRLRRHLALDGCGTAAAAAEAAAGAAGTAAAAPDAATAAAESACGLSFKGKLRSAARCFCEGLQQGTQWLQRQLDGSFAHPRRACSELLAKLHSSSGVRISAAAVAAAREEAEAAERHAAAKDEASTSETCAEPTPASSAATTFAVGFASSAISSFLTSPFEAARRHIVAVCKADEAGAAHLQGFAGVVHALREVVHAKGVVKGLLQPAPRRMVMAAPFNGLGAVIVEATMRVLNKTFPS